MARSVTVAQLVARAKQLADMEGSTFVSAAEWITYAHRHVTELWDLLVQAAPPDYFSADYTFSTSPGQRAYMLPGDFRTLTGVLVSVGGYQRRVLPLGPTERYASSAPSAVSTITLEYQPAPPTLTADTDTVDGVSGWEELISASMARDAMLKEETEASFVQNLIDREVMRVRTASGNRDRGQPKLIGRRGEPARSPWDAMAPEHTLRYRLRGGNIELFSV